MFGLTRSIPVNDPSNPDLPVLDRGQVWRGLVLKAENALPFVAGMTQCDVIEREGNVLVRDVVFRGELGRERVTLYPEHRVQFDRLSGMTRGTILNEIEDEDGVLALRFTFSLWREDMPHGSPEEQAYARQMENDYLGAVQSTLDAIRRWVKEVAVATSQPA